MADSSLRLQKYLAQAGVGSRRACEDLIRAGKVTIDDVVATLGSSVDPESQRVEVNGQPVEVETKEYWLLNKPRGVISTAFDPEGRPTVVDAVPSKGRVFPVGRLDVSSTGLLILTNDGELTAQLLHPRYHVEKEYLVTIRGTINQGQLARLRNGIELEEGRTSPAQVDVLELGRTPRGTTTTLRFVIHEGRKRQIRRMVEAVGEKVLALHRRRFDRLTDEGLPLGQARRLSQSEVDSLRTSADRAR